MINVAPSAQVRIDGPPATLAQVRRLENATTISIDGAPATTVRVQIPPGRSGDPEGNPARGRGNRMDAEGQ